MEKIAIKVDSVSKSFKLPHEKTGSVKSAFVGLFNGKRTYEKQDVLRDISLEIKEGEFFGIVGRNGSGKSTLLKLLAGVYSPDNGHIIVNGKLTPFIELGVGFNPELTGRENVFLNGALLGFNRNEMDAMYDEIVEFAELEKFMDQKLKNYSSGMQVRLAFSIAIKSDSPILIFDEVLAVGDENFQKKCVAVFENYKAEKQTIVLVTHDMETVKKYCSRAILLSDGLIVSSGSPDRVANEYSKMNDKNYAEQITKKNEKKPRIDAKVIINKVNFAYGDELVADITYHNTKVENVGVAIYKNSGEYVFGANTILDKVAIGEKGVVYKAKLDIGPGNYHIKVGLFGKKDDQILEFIDDGPEFIIKSNDNTWEGIAKLKHSWEN